MCMSLAYKCPTTQGFNDASFGSDYVPLVNLIGVYFQIRDDLMNLQSTEVRCYVFYFFSGVSLSLV
jgi:geranylgeranyl pyrophosphate synthase